MQACNTKLRLYDEEATYRRACSSPIAKLIFNQYNDHEEHDSEECLHLNRELVTFSHCKETGLGSFPIYCEAFLLQSNHDGAKSR